MHEIKVPELAESITEGDIGTWLKENGAYVQKNEPILELQTDKASVEIVAQVAGTLEHLRAEGETVEVGEIVAKIDESASAPVGDASSPAQKPAPAPAEKPAQKASPPASAPTQKNEPAKQTKADGAAATERSASAPAKTAGAPAGGSGAAPVPEMAGPDGSGTRRERITRLRRTIAARLVEAQRTAAILTTFNEIDMTEVMALRKANQDWFRERHGVKLGFMSLFGRAAIASLQEYPEINAWIDGDEVVYHDHVHLGIAVGTDKGLVVPVIREADTLSLGELEKAIQDMATRARDGKVAIQDLQGGTFTVSNGGIYGSLLSTPILNPPQSGILGMHAIQKRPIVLDDDSIVARPMMYVALSYDHRIVDGEQSVRFLVSMKQRLEDPERMLLGG